MKGPEYGLRPDEIAQLLDAVGKLTCPGDTADLLSFSTAALIGRANQIVASAHPFFRKDNTPRGGRDECVFEPSSKRVKGQSLDFSEGKFKLGTTRPYDKGGRDLDHAVVRLKNNIRGVVPLKIDPKASEIQEGEELIVISSGQDRMNCKVNENEPVVQVCRAMKVYGPNHRAGSAIYTNCSGTNQASGSIALRRDESGELVVVGTMVSTGSASKDHQEFSMENSNFSRFNVIDDKFRRDFDEVNSRTDRASSL